jgi:hypothetical protein
MKINIIKKNEELAEELGIPCFTINAAQRYYYPYHLRRCTRYLEWLMALNCILILSLLFLFFTQNEPGYYLTAFNGTNTRVFPTTLNQAIAVTQQANTQGTKS